jgi:hypothetical protein
LQRALIAGIANKGKPGYKERGCMIVKLRGSNDRLKFVLGKTVGDVVDGSLFFGVLPCSAFEARLYGLLKS